MSKLYRYYARGRHPRGFWGKCTLKAMNDKRHAALPEWVFEELKIGEMTNILDVGCGGGANIKRMLAMCPEARITGIDLSNLAIEVANELNYREVIDERCLIIGGNAAQMPLARDIFDMVTAFETIYYWPSLDGGVSEMMRVLKPGGTLVIANEMDGEAESDRMTERAVGGIRIYTIDEIKQSLNYAGFNNIDARHDEGRRFICVTARKPRD